MITATIIAVALGMTPVDAGKPAQFVTGNYETMVGRYSQSTDRRGTVHIRGFDPRNGAPYELTINSRGEVEAEVAEHVVNFRVQPAQ